MVPETRSMADQIFLSFWAIFCPPFYSTNNPKNLNLEKIKQTPGDIIILHKHIKYHNHILYCSLDMARDSYVIFIFHLLPPSPPSLQQPKKSKLKKEIKMPGDNVPFLSHGAQQMDRRTVRQTDGKSDI